MHPYFLLVLFSMEDKLMSNSISSNKDNFVETVNNVFCKIKYSLSEKFMVFEGSNAYILYEDWMELVFLKAFLRLKMSLKSGK